MALTVYHPLEAVYAFHEKAETWILRRYPAAVVEAPGAERVRSPAWGETPVAVFPERQPRRERQTDAGQSAPETRTIYLRTQVRLTDTTTNQPTDVLFAPDGTAWQSYEDGRWDEARGYAVRLTRSGRRGMRPWL